MVGDIRGCLGAAWGNQVPRYCHSCRAAASIGCQELHAVCPQVHAKFMTPMSSAGVLQNEQQLAVDAFQAGCKQLKPVTELAASSCGLHLSLTAGTLQPPQAPCRLRIQEVSQLRTSRLERLELADEKLPLRPLPEERGWEPLASRPSCVAGSGCHDSPVCRSWLMDAQRRASAAVMNSAPSVAACTGGEQHSVGEHSATPVYRCRKNFRQCLLISEHRLITIVCSWA